MAKNVLGTELQLCSADPLTGYNRDGCCNSSEADEGTHVVCAQMTQAFLEFSQAQGNDLITPIPELHFAGLKAGDQWCLCVLRWKDALDADMAPPVVLEATHEVALRYVSLKDLQRHMLTTDKPANPFLSNGHGLKKS